MPGPGHPGHFPRPWNTGGMASAGGPSSGGEASSLPPEGGPGKPQGPSAARAAEAAAKVADLLAEGENEDDDAGAPAPRAKERRSTVGRPVEPPPSAADELAKDLAKAVAARDDYLERLQRLQADFENYKKRVLRQQVEDRERAAEDLVVKLLPVLDNFDLAMAHHDDGLEPVYRSLMSVLEGAGVERLDPVGQPFDPNEHDAVLHEEGEEGGSPEVIEVLRAGYRWKGRVLRPAMVKVKG